MNEPRRHRVLIAEDDPSIRRMLTVSLGKQGYEMSEACDGSEALEAMRADAPDLVVLDLMMPKVTGWEVLAERAGDPKLRSIPVIVITAERGDRVTKIREDGVAELLPKPFSLDELQALVKSGLA
jgi:CheY-like chemotaxis protein